MSILILILKLIFAARDIIVIIVGLLFVILTSKRHPILYRMSDGAALRLKRAGVLVTALGSYLALEALARRIFGIEEPNINIFDWFQIAPFATAITILITIAIVYSLVFHGRWIALDDLAATIASIAEWAILAPLGRLSNRGIAAAIIGAAIIVIGYIAFESNIFRQTAQNQETQQQKADSPQLGEQIVSQRERNGTIQQEQDVAAQQQREASAQREQEAASQRERDAAAQRQRDAAIQREQDAAKQREHDAAAQRERDAAIEREQDAARQRERDAAAQRQRDAAIQREQDAAKQRERDAAVQRDLFARREKEMLAATGFSSLDDSDITGTALGLTRAYHEVASLSDCAKECRSQRTCSAFTFSRQPVSPGSINHFCYFYAAPLSQLRGHSGWMVGIRQ